MNHNIEKLFTQYYQILRAYAFRYVQNQDVAKDIVQDVFFELWLRRNEIDFGLPMKAYLFKAVLNKSRNYINDKRVKDKVNLDEESHMLFIDDYLQSFIVYQEDSLLLKDLDREIKSYIDSLPEQCHRIFIMSRGQGLDSLNLAACHACGLLPETCCEERNAFLDRGVIVGTYENPEIGFWNDIDL